MSSAAPSFTTEQLAEFLALEAGADSVELKLTLPDEDQRSVVRALGIDPLEAEIRQVFFFDTPDLALDARGIVGRARRGQRKGDDSTVKLRPVVPQAVGDALLAFLRSDPQRKGGGSRRGDRRRPNGRPEPPGAGGRR